MQKKIFGNYTIYVRDINKSKYQNVDQIIEKLKAQVDAHPATAFIAIFDHYAHTSALPKGQIDETILDAKNIVFCFGVQIPNPEMLSVRPRSIGVAELEEGFVISFQQAPATMPQQSMEEWVDAL